MQRTTDSRGVQVTYGYDLNGNLTSGVYTWTNPDNGADVQTLTTQWIVNGDDKLTQTISPDGTTTTTFDALGRAVSVTDRFGMATQTTYDSRGLVVESRK